jgi:ATP-binding cassette subfamily B protein
LFELSPPAESDPSIMNMNTTAITWPPARLGEALAALAQHNGRAAAREAAPVPPAAVCADPGNRLGRWIEGTAAWLGCEAEPVEAPYAEAEKLVACAGPALLRVPGAGEPRFVVLLPAGRRRAAVLTPEHTVARPTLEDVRQVLHRPLEAPHAEAVEQLLDGVGLRGVARTRARRSLLGDLLTEARIGGWLVRPTAADAGAAVRRDGVLRLLLILSGSYLGCAILWLLAWWVLGAMALRGQPEHGYLIAWLLLLLTLIPCRMVASFAEGALAVRAGTILKRRLLIGALRLEPDEVRRQGVGQLLGRTLEADRVATLALTGGCAGLMALLELTLAGVVLGAGARSGLHVGLLVGTVLGTALLTWLYTRRCHAATEERLRLTNDLVERMFGHRTRLAQQSPGRWHTGEDEVLAHYVGSSARLDRLGNVLQVMVPRGWFVIAFLGLAPSFVQGDGSALLLAVGVGGIVLAFRALHKLGSALEPLAAAAVAWKRVRFFWDAAALREPVGHPRLTCPGPGSGADRTLLAAQGLVFGYGEQGERILQGADLQIAAGDRVLLEGASGSGKSTLAAVLAGARAPSSGLLLLGGLDPATLGANGWRQRVVLAPQFHENHVLMGTFAFNALMGREWPPSPQDLREAERVCRGLGLGPLLDRMPGGLAQVVGETGWRLSHGEKSRLFLARALLQRADLLILDESVAALDPITLQQSLLFVLEQAPAVVVIAHP